ncbi:hypothetical protein CHLRE_05g234643v5 [Chlamydomonas reinhardtii]|uniref:Uncharacterized protein n=1 Tax=Chlamydomonas reinhardtii TaxID=3055 RepID=A0A2K3DSM9_CHLRE|nr:uncharacterized protein CHLRE_05g234643v5 [Chlamydomonas reinhardtii]PNW83531.1 hypothetical protein CHLRE_05g234643v5 [Chlamydomonas reinhardtii]
MPRTAEVAVVRRVGVEEIADFWLRLAAFVSLRWPRGRWDLAPNQLPFLASDDVGGVIVGPATRDSFMTRTHGLGEQR